MEEVSRSIRTVLVVDPHHFLHIPFIHAATLGCLTSLGVNCISLSIQREAIQAELQGIAKRGDIPGADPALVCWGDLSPAAGSSWAQLEVEILPWMKIQGCPKSTLIWIGWLDWLVGRSRKNPCLPSWPWNWAGAYYHLPASFVSSQRWSRQWCNQRLLPIWRFLGSERCKGLAVLDEYWLHSEQESLINRFFRPSRRKLLHFPDVASTHADPLCTPVNRSDGKIRIGLFGQLSWRKGVVPFLRAASLAEQLNPQLEFLMSGELQLQHFSASDQKEILGKLAQPHVNLHYCPQPPSNEAAFNALVQMADVIHIAYNQFTGSSNLLTKAANFGIPVIAKPEHLIGRRVRDFSLGWLTTDETEQAYFQLVLGLNCQKIKLARAMGRWHDYLVQHDLQRLRDMLSQILS